MPTKIDERKRQSSLEDEPMQRVFRQREDVTHQAHENEILRLELTRESREALKTTGKGGNNEVSRLQDQAALFVKKIELEKKKIEDLDQQISEYQAKIMDQKTRVGGVNAAQTNNQLVRKQIKVLEGRLDKSLLKFNDVLAQNKVLRQKIDEYRRERVVFDGIYKKLERELHEKKREMNAVIEDSKNAYQARERAHNEMLSVKQHAAKEKADFETDFKELGELIRQQQYQLEQLRLKQFERSPSDGNIKFETGGTRENELASTASWQGTKDKIAPLSQETVKSYEEELAKVQMSTGVHDINELVTRFLETEEQNFSLFNYVNDVNTEIERLEQSTASMRNQIEKYRGQGMSSDNQRKKALKDLEEKVKRAEVKDQEYSQRHDRAMRTIAQLKNGIHSIFTRIGAANTSVEEMLGSQGVTESNMMQYLGIIEQRTSEILQAYALSQQAQTTEQLLEFPSVLEVSRNKLNVHPPTPDENDAHDVEDAQEEDDRPLTRQELDKKTAKEYAKRLQTQHAGELSTASFSMTNSTATASEI